MLHYIGGVEYREEAAIKIESIHHAEGRVTYDENDEAQYEYHLKDHLGNVRVAFADKDGDGYIEPFSVNPNEPNAGGDGTAWDLTNTEILQESHYYPFGMAMDGACQDIMNGPENKYLYNGKELNEDFGLDWSDYGARWYDASIGRWNAVDPLAEAYSSVSTYSYTLNNPIKFIDPDGMRVSLFDKLANEYGHKYGITAEQAERKKAFKNFQSEVDKGNYNEALEGMSKFYGFDNISSNFKFNASQGIDKGVLTTTSEKIEKGAAHTINMNPNILISASKSEEAFNDFSILIFHEVIHVDQRSGDKLILDHNEREFLAYHATIGPTGSVGKTYSKQLNHQLKSSWLPNPGSNSYIFYKNKMTQYYNRLSRPQKIKYKNAVYEFEPPTILGIPADIQGTE